MAEPVKLDFSKAAPVGEDGEVKLDFSKAVPVNDLSPENLAKNKELNDPKKPTQFEQDRSWWNRATGRAAPPAEAGSAAQVVKSAGNIVGRGLEGVGGMIAHPIETAKGAIPQIHELFNPTTDVNGPMHQRVQQFIEEYQRNPAEAVENASGDILSMYLAGKLTKGAGKLATVAGKAIKRVSMPEMKALTGKPKSMFDKYSPTAVPIAGEDFPVLAGEAHPETSGGKLQTRMKRSGVGAEKFEKVETAQQNSAKNVIRNTAQRTSGMTGPMQEEPGPAVGDAADATFAKARPMYKEMDESLLKVPDTLESASRVTRDAIKRAEKLGVRLSESDPAMVNAMNKELSQYASDPRMLGEIRKFYKEKYGIGENEGQPLETYMTVRSELLKMQRASSDAAIRYTIGQEIEAMNNNMQSALNGSPLEAQWSEARRLWSKGYALREVSDALHESTKGTPASKQAPGLSKVPTETSGSSLVSRLNNLDRDGTLDRAFTPEEASNLRQSADLLDRIQKTPIGKGMGESMSMSRGLAHAVRGATGPMAGAGIGFILGGIRGAEAGAGLGFIVQAVGERALVNVMTKIDGVKALTAVADSGTPEAFNAAVNNLKRVAKSGALEVGTAAGAAAAPKKKVADFLKP